MEIYTYRIKTQEEYEAVKLRVEKGTEKLEGLFMSDDPKVQAWVNRYNELATAMLHWEIDHDLLPI